MNKRQLQVREARHEDIADLLSLGASLAEIIERSGYKGWAGVRTSLQRAGKTELLEKLKIKLVDADLPRQRRKPRPKCEANHLCANRPIDGLCLYHWRVRQRDCRKEGCWNPHSARGFCNMHYFREKRAGRIAA